MIGIMEIEFAVAVAVAVAVVSNCILRSNCSSKRAAVAMRSPETCVDDDDDNGGDDDDGPMIREL